ncbi:hypothetical protein [Paenibacillus sp. FSL R7-0179]|uniref:hypothetical protein n=1 Tax=Paenibacillus sp. FSL R7-0179 TaxID=2921672 RepID=UPI0030F77730
MNKIKKFFLVSVKAILQVIFIVFIHLFVIRFLNLKSEVWEEEAVRQAYVVSFVLIILLYATCMISLLTKRLICNLIWFCISTVPSVSLLILFYNSRENEPTENYFIDLNFDSGFFELVIIVPVIYIVIQIVFIFVLWVMKCESIKNNTPSHSLCTVGYWTTAILNLFSKDKNRGLGNKAIEFFNKDVPWATVFTFN